VFARNNPFDLFQQALQVVAEEIKIDLGGVLLGGLLSSPLPQPGEIVWYNRLFNLLEASLANGDHTAFSGNCFPDKEFQLLYPFHSSGTKKKNICPMVSAKICLTTEGAVGRGTIFLFLS